MTEKPLFLIPSILWHRQWGVLPDPGSLAEGLALQSDRLILLLNLAGYEVTRVVVCAPGNTQVPFISLDLATRTPNESTQTNAWQTTTGLAWPGGASAAIGLEVRPRTLLDSIVDVFAVEMLNLKGTIEATQFRDSTYKGKGSGWLIATFSCAADKDPLERIADTIRPLIEATADDLIDLWDGGPPVPPHFPNPVPRGLVWMYDPYHWRFSNRFGDTPWSTLVNLVDWVCSTKMSSPQSLQQWKDEIIEGIEPNLLQYLEEWEEAGGAIGIVAAEEITKVAKEVFKRSRGFLGTEDEILIEDLPLLPYTLVLLILQDLHLVNFFGAVDAATPKDEWSHEDLSGFYESLDDDRDDTLQINQAGGFLEGSWQLHLAPSQYTLLFFQTYTIAAEKKANAAFQFTFTQTGEHILGWHLVYDPEKQTFGYEPYGESVVENGTLTVDLSEDQPKLTIEINGSSIQFVRVSKRLRMSDELINSTPEEFIDTIRASDRFPLHSAELAKLRQAMDGLVPALENYYAIDARERNGDQLARKQGAADLDHAFVQTLIDTYGAPQSLTLTPHNPPFAEQTAQARQLAIGLLTSRKMSTDTSIPNAWSGLSEPLYFFPNETPNLRAFFGITQLYNIDELLLGNPHHIYEWKMSGIGISADFMGGGLVYPIAATVIKKLSGDPMWPDSARYPTFITGISAGLSVGGNVFFAGLPNTLDSVVHWSEGDFVGTAFYLTTNSAWYGGAIGASEALKSYAIFMGDGTHIPVTCENKFDRSFIVGLGMGYEVGAAMWCQLYASVESETPDRPLPQPQYTVITNESDSTMLVFEVDKATLTKQGRRLIQEFCVRHRAVLAGAHTQITIDGYASTTGEADYNLDLSQRRAAAVFQAIRDYTKESLYVPWHNIAVRGFGEDPALPHGDEEERPEWRKVEVSIDGILSLKLVGGTVSQ